MFLTIVLIFAFVLDRFFGEPTRWHPLVGFGRWASFIESRLNTRPSSNRSGIILGAAAWFIVISIPVACILGSLMLGGVQSLSGIHVLAASVLLYLAIAPRSLAEHAIAVQLPLQEGDLETARHKLSYIVSRDTEDLDQTKIAKATIETVVENTNDAVIAPVFWFVVAGIPGVLIFRMVNTLDAMWGYRTERFLFFGRVAARADDLMGYIPARLTVMLFTLYNRDAYGVARRDGPKWYSPNAGPVMAAGAGALDLSLGGATIYHGKEKSRPILGDGREPVAEDIGRSLFLVNQSCGMLLAAVATVEGLIYVFF